MKKEELLKEVAELAAKKDFNEAKKFIEKNKDELGEYVKEAEKLLEGSKELDGVVDKIKNLF